MVSAPLNLSFKLQLTDPAKFPNDTIRLLYSCMICETLDQVTIRMNYVYNEAEVNCNCCGYQWKTKVTRKSRDPQPRIP